MVLGADRREDIDCDYAALHDALSDYIEDHSGLPKLRTYWYDGAPGPHGEPTADHRRIGSLPGLKLRPRSRHPGPAEGRRHAHDA